MCIRVELIFLDQAIEYKELFKETDYLTSRGCGFSQLAYRQSISHVCKIQEMFNLKIFKSLHINNILIIIYQKTTMLQNDFTIINCWLSLSEDDNSDLKFLEYQ